jgi:NAD(P)H-hydrate epimerase
MGQAVGVIPVVTPEEMGAIDRAAPEPVEVLISRAGGAVARAALELMGGGYGRRVVVIEGKGNNGNDGREAARRLRARGVKVTENDAAAPPESLPPCDLVIDAAFGTGFRGVWEAPNVEPGTPVLAVDIPSGVDGRTGEASGRVLHADRTVTFAALKPGLLLHPGADLAGEVSVADIGLDVSSARIHEVEPIDVARWYPRRGATAHKWQAAVWVIGGSPGLEGAAVLTSTAAMRAGAGYVRWSSPGEVPSLLKPTEVVGTALPETGWAGAALDDAHRFKCITVGNGLGLGDLHRADVRRLVAEAPIPVVVDADALTHLGDRAADVTTETTILTPHDGEYARLMGGRPGPDRVAAAREASAKLGAIMVLKGPTTVVAEPSGRVLLCTAGDARLATLGTGDVLAGVIAALVARGLDPFEAAAAGAYLHGAAGALGWRHGLVASDVATLLPVALDHLLSLPDQQRSDHDR